jgi:hypothetical protein
MLMIKIVDMAMPVVIYSFALWARQTFLEVALMKLDQSTPHAPNQSTFSHDSHPSSKLSHVMPEFSANSQGI